MCLDICEYDNEVIRSLQLNQSPLRSLTTVWNTVEDVSITGLPTDPAPNSSSIYSANVCVINTFYHH